MFAVFGRIWNDHVSMIVFEDDCWPLIHLFTPALLALYVHNIYVFFTIIYVYESVEYMCSWFVGSTLRENMDDAMISDPLLALVAFFMVHTFRKSPPMSIQSFLHVAIIGIWTLIWGYVYRHNKKHHRAWKSASLYFPMYMGLLGAFPDTRHFWMVPLIGFPSVYVTHGIVYHFTKRSGWFMGAFCYGIVTGIVTGIYNYIH